MRFCPPSIAFGPYIFDPNSRMLKKDGAELPLPPRVTGVLEVLLRRAGDVVPRQELMESVWKDAFVTDTSLAEAVSALRQALGDDPQAPTYIQTLHRRGYRFVAPVAEGSSSRLQEWLDATVASRAGSARVCSSVNLGSAGPVEHRHRVQLCGRGSHLAGCRPTTVRRGPGRALYDSASGRNAARWTRNGARPLIRRNDD